MSYKTILIDDEPLALSRLKRLLASFEDIFDIIDTATNGKEGLLKINELKPDLIFLDIEMPLLNGFEMLQAVKHMPKVIFCTAYDQYAIQAFEENSLDYLLKPVEKERLQKTVEKLSRLVAASGNHITENKVFAQILQQLMPKKDLHSIAVKSGDKILFIPLGEICFFQAEDKYVFLNTLEGRQYLTSQTIISLAEKLPETFVQISRAAIVHRHYIVSMEKGFNNKYLLHLADKKCSKLESGSSFVDKLRNLLEM